MAGPSAPLPATLLDDVAALARAAGEVVMAVYARGFTVAHKADASPVTEADEAAEALLVPALQALLPGVPVVAEEAAARGEVPAVGARFWLVDPLDGTREFVSRNGEFTVNVALVEDGLPVLGVVLQPAADRLWAGWVGQGAWQQDGGPRSPRRPLRGRAPPREGLVLAGSRSHGDEAALAAWLAQAGIAPAARRAVGSSLKFGLLAAGEADVYPRLGRTMEWDTAAGHAVLSAAGGRVCRLDGTALRYGKPGFENPHFVAWGRA